MSNDNIVDKSTNGKLGFAIVIVIVVALAGVFGFVGNEPAARSQSSSQGGWG